MSRSSLVSVCLAVTGLFVALAAPVSAAAPMAQQATTITFPRSTAPGRLTVVTVKLPSNVAAVDGRLLVAKGAAELIGIAPVGGGTGLQPERVTGGFAFGAYGLNAVNAKTVVRLVVNPLKAGTLQLRVLIDSTATRAGARIDGAGSVVGKVGVAGASRLLTAPALASVPSFAATRPAGAVRKLVGRGKINSQDLDVARLSWDESRLKGKACGTAVSGDANDDGCTDIVDLQAISAAIGTRSVSAGQPRSASAAATVGTTYTVNTGGDRADVNVGDGICLDNQGNCSLRAAIQEADWRQGDDRIEFNIPGGAPALVQLTNSLPIITSKKGTVTIDGYTEPGASVNTATILTNAVIGVEVRGTGGNGSDTAFRITSFGNTIRGVAISNEFRGILVDGANAHDNKIIGNWIGFTGSGSNSGGRYGILLNTGATVNHVGTSDLADRNLIGNWAAGVDHYGPGTNGNVTQNNVFCIRPNGQTATCSTGVDHNFGPKDGLIGGTGANELNVFGPTSLQGVEYSHGWNPAYAPRVDDSVTWQINGNRTIGNWIGFRADGTYDPNYASGLTGGGDNGQAVNVYDSSNSNVVKGNYLGTAKDGVQIMAPDARYNEVRDNFIGVSPLGGPAPLSGWGVRIRWGTTFDIISGNTIRNAASGGIGLTQNTVYNIKISQNIISDTNGPAIYLAPDPSNPSHGANTLLASPSITDATTAKVKGTGIVGATVEVYQASLSANGSNRGLPIAYLGSAVVTSNGKWTVAVSGLVAGDRVTALQIRPDSNTSALAVNVDVIDAGPIDLRIAADDFERTSASGWGTAVVGGPWAVSGSVSAYTLSGGAAHIDTPAGTTREAVLTPDIPAANMTVSGVVNFDRVPVGGNAFAYVDARRSGKSAYRAQIRVATNGKVYLTIRESSSTGVESAVGTEVNTGLTTNPAMVLAFRFTVIGGHLQARIWDASTVEPSTWQTEVDDASITAPGGVALRAFTGAPVTNGSVIVSFDNLLANPAP